MVQLSLVPTTNLCTGMSWLGVAWPERDSWKGLHRHDSRLVGRASGPL